MFPWLKKTNYFADFIIVVKNVSLGKKKIWFIVPV